MLFDINLAEVCVINEPSREETGLQGLTRSYKNRPIYLQLNARILKFWVEVENSSIYVTKALVNCAVTAQLICAFVFT